MGDTWFRSTRGDKDILKASEAILRGTAPDGGLYVPDYIPHLGRSFREYALMDYHEIAEEIIGLFFTDYSKREIHAAVTAAYDDKFDAEEIIPITCANGSYFMELWHGKTGSAKDISLSIMPYFVVLAQGKNNESKKAVLISATSADTGKAAAEGFLDVPGTEIVVFYPRYATSGIRERALKTQEGSNIRICGVDSDIDDLQDVAAGMYADERLKRRMSEAGYLLSSVNAVNIARIIPQITPFVYAYARLLREGEIGEGYRVNICVPTGGMGTLLAAYYASFMGLPVNRFISASNANAVLSDFFKTGHLDCNRRLKRTASSSLDVLLAENLERLIFRIGGDSPVKNVAVMNQLAREGSFELSYVMKPELAHFYGNSATDEECAEGIRHLLTQTGYMVEPHTAVAYCVHQKYINETHDNTATLIVSPEHPFKHPAAVLNALEGRALLDRTEGPGDFVSARKLGRMLNIPVPQTVRDLENLTSRHDKLCDADGMLAHLKRTLDI